MKEVSLFKKSFWFGRLIWITGGPSVNKEEKLGNLLLGCQILPSEIFHLDADQFVDMFLRGIDRELMKRFEVVVVKGFEDLNGNQAAAFLRAIKLFSDLQSGFSLQLILVSHHTISADLNRFQQFNPTEISVGDDNEDPGETNERLHHLLSIAMKITGVSVNRISERAAVFLEGFLAEETGDETNYELLVLISMGLGRSDGGELKLRDLIPRPFTHHPKVSTAEIPCF
jgi:hypothetical protein